jgi:protein involved in polysaccharide export with SLBB domain
LAETAYKKDVKLIRTSKDRITRQMFRIPLHKIEAGEVADILLTPEDVVIVPHTTKIVYVLGAVRSPGGYAIPQTGLTAAQAVAMAGGLGKFAAAGSVQILRQGPERKQIVVSVELDKVLAGDLSSDRDLQPGDILVVPTGFW